MADFFALKKQLVREMEWSRRLAKLTPQWLQFESSCYVGTEIPEEVMFKAHYRPKARRIQGDSVIELAEIFYIMMFVREHRVLAYDTNLDGQRHRNPLIAGRPYSGQTIEDLTHVHLWTYRGDLYVEPVDPPILELEALITKFCTHANLQLNGPFAHPLVGQTLELL